MADANLQIGEFIKAMNEDAPMTERVSAIREQDINLTQV